MCIAKFHSAKINTQEVHLFNNATFQQCHVGCKDGRNGRDGKDGVNGLDGQVGKPGRDGRDGRDGKIGVRGLNGRDGIDGKNGVNCEPKNWKECAYRADSVTDIGIIKVKFYNVDKIKKIKIFCQISYHFENNKHK